MNVACRCCSAFLFPAALCAAAPNASADVVTLDNGDRLSGKVLHKAGDTLVLETAYAGKISVSWNHVASLITDTPILVQFVQSALPFATQLDAAKPGRIFTRADGRETRLTEVAYLNPTPDESGTGTVYSGHATLSSSDVHGNSANSRLYAEGELTARTHTRRYSLGLKAERATDSGTQSASNWLGNANADHFIDAKRFFYGRGALEKNRFTDLRLRSSVGGGYGFQFYETERTKLSLRGGLDYVTVDRYAGAGESYPAAGWGASFTHRLAAIPLVAFHEQDGFVSLRDAHKVTLHSRTGLRMPIAGGLAASMQLNIDWERTPAPGRKRTDAALLMGVGYHW